jgi:TPR repeat protein
MLRLILSILNGLFIAFGLQSNLIAKFICPIPENPIYRDNVNSRVYNPALEHIEFKVLQEKAKSGDAKSQWMLGCQLFSGKVTDEDSLGTMELIKVLEAPPISKKTKEEGLNFLRKSASQNFSQAIKSLCTALRFNLEKKEEKALVLKILELANSDKDFFCFAAIIFQYGYGDLDVNENLARNFWIKAATEGFPLAEMQLVRLSIEEDEQKKLDLLVSASRKGLGAAQYTFGKDLLSWPHFFARMLNRNSKDKEDEHAQIADAQKAGIYWLHKSALSGCIQAQKLIAEKLTNGIQGVVEADYEEAVKWSNAAKVKR